MLERAAVLSQRWAARLGQTVMLHIGVHSGPVVAGSLGAAAGAAYAVTGDTVNTTARLLAAAAPGTILVSEATHALTRHRFAFEEPGGELALRGKAGALVVHRLVGALAEPRSGRGLAALGLRGAGMDARAHVGHILPRVSELAEMLGCMLYLPQRGVCLAPTKDELERAFKESRAVRFVRDPHAFLTETP